MTDSIAIHGHDIIDLVANHPEGIRLSQLMEIVAERYGRMATFHTCSAAGMDLDCLLRFLGPCSPSVRWMTTGMWIHRVVN